MVMATRSSCTPTVHEPTCLWKYPPTTAFLFAPFALLSVRDGLNALAMFVFTVTAASVIAVGQWMRARWPTTLTLALCTCVVSHPFVFDVGAVNSVWPSFSTQTPSGRSSRALVRSVLFVGRRARA
jgi:hypothetical protein